MSPPATTNSRNVYMVGIAWRAASATSCSIRLLKKASLPTSNASVRAWTKLKKADRRNDGHQLVQKRERLGPEFARERVEAGHVASRPIEGRNKPELHGVISEPRHDWDTGSCSLSRESSHPPG